LLAPAAPEIDADRSTPLEGDPGRQRTSDRHWQKNY
jgi:hypothetical protein